jgi:hypothetical protein
VGTRRPAAGYGVRASAAAAGDAAVVDGWALSCSAQRCGPFIDGPSHHGPPREEATAEWPHHPMRHRHPATPRKIPQLSLLQPNPQRRRGWLPAPTRSSSRSARRPRRTTTKVTRDGPNTGPTSSCRRISPPAPTSSTTSSASSTSDSS